MDRRRWMIGGAIGLTVLGLVGLASGLSSLDFSAGKPMPSLDLFPSRPSTGSPGATPTGFADIIRIFLGVVFWVLLPLSLVYVILSAEARRKLWRNLLLVASTLAFGYLLVRIIRMLDVRPPEEQRPPMAPGSGAAETRSVEPPDFVSQPPDWIIVLISGAVFAVIGLLVWRVWQGRQDGQSDDELQDELAQEAGSALDAIRSGQDLSNVVVRCYRDMERSVQRAYGLNRRASMTPREFERRLVGAGLEAEAVRRLTRLFEHARYGHKDVDAADEADAEACLAAIAGRVEAGEAA